MPRARAATSAPPNPDADALGVTAELPPDPAPSAPAKRRGRPPGSGTKKAIPARRSDGTVMSKAEMIDAVKGQVMMLVLPLATAWEFRDPECAAVLSEEVSPDETRLEAIVDRLITMIARNAAVLEFMARNTILLDAGMLMTLLMPIFKTVWKAHGPSGLGHSVDEEERASAYARDFPAYQPNSQPVIIG